MLITSDIGEDSCKITTFQQMIYLRYRAHEVLPSW